METVSVVIGVLRVIKKGQEKYDNRIPGTTSVSEHKKNLTSGNSPHPQKGSVNQVISFVPEGHGLDSVQASKPRITIQSTPDNSNLQGKSKKVRVIGSSKKIA